MWAAGDVGGRVLLSTILTYVSIFSTTTRGRPMSCMGPFINAAGCNAAGPKTLAPRKVVSIAPFGIVKIPRKSGSGSGR